ncbi:MAG TPA: ABC transporter substrate-binding protein [Acidimicrobiales bacterium]|nr:ABC transporter substrate-binding protein [Acidimicrobiales bacterium]
MAAAVGAGALMLAACGSGGSGGGGGGGGNNSSSPTTNNPGNTTPQVTQPAGKPKHGGTVTVAQSPGTSPNYIFPMSPSQNYSVYNTDIQTLLYRPLYYFGENNNPAIDYNKSIGQKPVFSDGGKVVTVTLNHFKWSDGENVDARDVVFWENLIKAEKSNWAAYVPGYYPDNIVKTSMPKGPAGNVVQFTLNRSYNPTWFTYNELSQITPMPIAWDKTKAGGATPKVTSANLPDTTTAGAKAVYTYLTTAAKSISSYTTSPLWTVIDGPWKLKEWSSQGLVEMVPNAKYTWTDKPYLSEFIYKPYTTDTAEYNDLRSSAKTLQVGYIPTQDIDQRSKVESEGYNTFNFYAWGVFYTGLNFKNPTAGPLFKQLYIRQALETLEDQAGWDRAYWNNIASPQYGPIPLLPKNKFISKFTETNPYPYSISAATKLLQDHGWTIHAKGADVCNDPAKCGAGITKGEKLSFNALVSNGVTAETDTWQDYKSDASQAGIQLNVKLESFDAVYSQTTSTNPKWQIAGGNGWTFAPDFYPTGEELWLTGSVANEGNYSNPTADKLIRATLTDPPAKEGAALTAYQNYLAKDLPVLWNPNAGTPQVVAKGLGGTALKPNALEYLDPENWYYVTK